METSVDPPIETRHRSWVGKRLWSVEEQARAARPDALPAHGVLAVVRRERDQLLAFLENL